MTREEVREQLKALFTEEEDIFNQTIEELDNYNGYLGDDRYYEMGMLDEFYHDTDPTEILRRAFFGYCEDYTDEHGNHTQEFSPVQDYFRYNGYGNLVSTDFKDYSDHLDNWFIDAVIDNADHLWLDDEVKDILGGIEE